MHLAGRDDPRDAAVQPAFDKIQRLLARRVVAKHRVGMRVDQPGPELAAGRVDQVIDTGLIDIARLADRRDTSRAHYHGVARQQRLVEIARDDLADVGDHQVAHRATSCFASSASTCSRLVTEP